jgi:uncharacterized repeat protein (TIGR03803 family)
MRISGLRLCLIALAGPTTAAAQPLQLVHAFEVPALSPRGGLVAMPDGSVYGTTAEGGAGGTIYRVAPGGGPLTIVARFDRGRSPGTLVRGSDGFLYGTTLFGGVSDYGTVFRFDPATARIETLHAFVPVRDGIHPHGVVVGADGLLYGTARQYLFPAPAELLFSLDPVTGRRQAVAEFPQEGPLGYVPGGGLVQTPAGTLYGTMIVGGRTAGGTFGYGTVYRVDPATREAAVVHVFEQTDGSSPSEGLTRTSDGLLYGTTAQGGAEDAGTIFRVDPATGAFASIYHLQPSNGTDGQAPQSRLVEGPDGALYGTTSNGSAGGGTIFRLRRLPGGGHAFATLLRVDAASVGSWLFADLAVTPDGWIYGAADSGGPLDGGTVFRFDSLERGPSGNALQFSVLHAFSRRGTGWTVDTPPVAGSDGKLYGMTRKGGANGRGDIYRLDPATGQTTVLASVPALGVDANQGISASTFVDGGDGSLYATVTSAVEGQILRVVPATGAVTVALSVPMTFGSTGFGAGLVRAGPSIYGLVDAADGLRVYRFDPATATMTPGPVVAGSVIDVALTGTPGGLIYVATTSIISGPGVFQIQDWLVRVDPAANTSQTITGGSRSREAVEPAAAPDGTIYFVGVHELGPDVIDAYAPAGGTIREACILPELSIPRALTVAPDGNLFVSTRHVGQDSGELYLCFPGSTEPQRLDPGIPGVRLLSGFTHAPGTALLYAANSGGPLGGGSIVRLAIAPAPPIVDGDGDGLANDWETAYGLDPTSAAGDDGAAGDPDGDGVSNAAELAAGTHPRGIVTQYLAEGATGAFFQTRLALANPGPDPAHVLVRFLTDRVFEGGPWVIRRPLVIPARARRTIDVGTLPGLASANFATIVESDVAIAVDRTMTWDASGYGSHTESAVASPSQTWYLAEGSTSGDFELFYLLQNPGAATITATVRYLRPFGQRPIERQYTLAGQSRTTIYVDRDPELTSTDLSAVITAPSPIIVERAMYRSRPGQPFAAGHASAGVTAPALEWFLAEGATGAFFDLFVLVANPNPTPAAITVEYLRLGGGVFTKSYTVPPAGRFTIWVDDETIPAGSGQKPLADAALSTTIRSTNGVPIIVERAMWWPGPDLTPDYWYEAHNSPGATSSATRWVAPGGEVGGMEGTGADTYILIANPTATPARVLVRLLFESGNTTGRCYDLPPKSRTNVWLGNMPILGDFPGEIEDGRAAVLVESVGTNPVPIVVERATYASPGGIVWAAGGNALATPVP